MTVTLSIASVVWALVALAVARMVSQAALRVADVVRSGRLGGEDLARRVNELERLRSHDLMARADLENEVVRIKNIEGID